MPQGYHPFMGLARGLQAGLKIGIAGRDARERSKDRKSALELKRDKVKRDEIERKEDLEFRGRQQKERERANAAREQQASKNAEGAAQDRKIRRQKLTPNLARQESINEFRRLLEEESDPKKRGEYEANIKALRASMEDNRIKTDAQAQRRAAAIRRGRASVPGEPGFREKLVLTLTAIRANKRKDIPKGFGGFEEHEILSILRDPVSGEISRSLAGNKGNDNPTGNSSSAGDSRENPLGVTTPEEAKKLPLGTWFTTTDGRILRRE